MKQRAVKPRLQLSYGGCESRLRNMAQLGPARKTQRLRHRKEIPHLVHFHHDTIGVDGSYGSITSVCFSRHTKQGLTRKRIDVTLSNTAAGSNLVEKGPTE